MRCRYLFLAILLLSLGSANGGEQYARLSELQPDLQQALVRDAVCSVKPSGASDGQVESALLDAAAPVTTQEILACGT